MKKNKITISELYQNPKYRARIILAFYFILFAILIAGIRSNPSYNENTNSNENKNEVTEKDEKEAPQEETKSLKSFDLIRSKNFEFNYQFEYEGITYQITGNKFQDKEIFDVVVNNQYYLYYQSNGEETKAKIDEEEGYQTAKKPYEYINYFNVSLLEEILFNSTMINETNYEIENNKLSEILEYGKELDGKSTIELEIKNEYITGITMDYSEFVKAIKNEENISKFTLKYSNFNLIDDFEITFL